MTEQDRRQNSREIETQLAELREDFSDLKQQIDDISEKQDAQANATAALVEAWNTGTGLVKFIKWAAVLSGSVATLTAVWHADFAAFFSALHKGNHP